MSIDYEILEGSLPLPDEQQESFAVLLSSGVSKTVAYREVFGDLAEDGEIIEVSLRSRATRLSQREEVAQRVHYLRGERSKRFDTAPEQLTEREVASLMERLSPASGSASSRGRMLVRRPPTSDISAARS